MCFHLRNFVGPRRPMKGTPMTMPKRRRRAESLGLVCCASMALAGCMSSSVHGDATTYTLSPWLTGSFLAGGAVLAVAGLLVVVLNKAAWPRVGGAALLLLGPALLWTCAYKATQEYVTVADDRVEYGGRQHLCPGRQGGPLRGLPKARIPGQGSRRRTGAAGRVGHALPRPEERRRGRHRPGPVPWAGAGRPHRAARQTRRPCCGGPQGVVGGDRRGRSFHEPIDPLAVERAGQQIDLPFLVFSEREHGLAAVLDRPVGDDAALRLVVAQGPDAGGDVIAVDVVAVQLRQPRRRGRRGRR